MADANAQVQQALDEAVNEHGEIGLQAAVYLNGELIIDCWSGLADRPSGREVDGDTLFTVFSATKGVAATALHIQAERGHVDYDATVASYWPEFAANGKGSVTVRDALTHRVGVPQMPEGTTPEQMCDWEHMTAAVAALEPVWEPGTKAGYHAYTFGWIVGELVRRTDPKKRPFGQYIQDEICAPLGIDSLWMGIPDEVEPRVATLTNTPAPPPDAPTPPPDALILKAIPPDLGVVQEIFGRPDVRRSCHPGAGGIMNARSLARHYALLAGKGELDGVRLLSPERVDQARTLQSDETDQVIGAPYRRGMGYFLGNDPGMSAPMGSNPGVFGHVGAGGSIGWADPDAGLAVAIIKNRMLAPATPEDNPLTKIGAVIRSSLGVAG